jgi:outer membrane protein OmpA-like peptidoglycan-associated protein
MKNRYLITGLSFVWLTACVTDPHTGQSTVSNTAKGAGFGAAAGAAIGTLFGGNDWKNAGFGALAGGAVGAAVGAYMDHQQEEMEQSLSGTGIEVERTAENTLNLNMPNSVSFGFDSANLTPQAQTAVNSVARILNQYPDSTITVTGHTDDLGSDHYNQRLSEQRAASVASYLLRHGVSDARLSQQGMGERTPRYPNSNEMNRAQNRRVELTIVATNNAGAQPSRYQSRGSSQDNYLPRDYRK